jgi:hypothetical protein
MEVLIVSVQLNSRSKAWHEVEGRFESLGNDLREHFDKVGKEAAAERAGVEESIRSLLAALDDGFGAAGKTVRDAKLRKDLSKIATAVREALITTLEDAGTNVRKRLSAPAIAHKNDKSPARAATPKAKEKKAVRNVAPHKVTPPKVKAHKTSGGRPPGDNVKAG